MLCKKRERESCQSKLIQKKKRSRYGKFSFLMKLIGFLFPLSFGKKCEKGYQVVKESECTGLKK